jgi:hypothetical protein
MDLIVVLILLGLAFWAIGQLAGAFGIPAPIVTMLHVLLVVIFVLYLLRWIGVVGGGGESFNLRF